MKELPVDHIPLDIPLAGAMLHLSGAVLMNYGQILTRKHLTLLHMAGIDSVALLGPLDRPKRYEAELKTRDVYVTGLTRGECLARAVYDTDDRLILDAGMKINDEAIGALLLNDIETVRVAKTRSEIKASQVSNFKRLMQKHVELGEPIAGIDPQNDIESLVSYVRAVQYADELKLKHLPVRLPKSGDAGQFKSDPYVLDSERTELVEELFWSIVSHVNALLQSAALYETISANDINQTTDLLKRAFNFDWVDLVCVAARANAKEYARSIHTVYVMVLCMLMAREMGISEHGQMLLVRAAALHDFGMERIRESLLNKPSALSQDELAEVKRHVVYGLEIAGSIKGFEPDISLMIYHSHEEPSGRGYPCAIKRPDIHQGGAIIHTAALFSALTAPRPYRASLFPHSAIIKLSNQASSQHVDMASVNALQTVLGTYPIGSWVELSELRQGIVVESNRLGTHSPAVLVSHIADERLNSGVVARCVGTERIVYAIKPKNHEDS